MSTEWIFDPAPPSGKRTGGNAAEYGFKGHIDTLVRESVQNSMDARIDPAGPPARVVFRLIDLTEGYYEQFLDHMAWDSLEDNLNAVPDRRGGAPINKAISEMERENRLRLLVIEDYETRGLEGEEKRTSDDERNSYCALVRDELYSDKPGEDAGGSFGLGKTLLWAYSGFKTVLFASVPLDPPEGKMGLRFVGRTSLPYHETDTDEKCSGDGWLGIPRNPNRHDRHAVSVWGEEAHRVAEVCCCDRGPDYPGLSAVIVGFTEPGKEDRSREDIVQSIKEAALGSFWPAIVREQLVIEVHYELNDELIVEDRVTPSEHEGYLPAVELLNQFDADELEEKDRIETGESAVRWVSIEVPKRTADPEHAATDVRVAVLVRLLEDDDVFAPIRDQVFRFRKPGMIIRSGGGKNLSIAARPYVATVLAGEASGQDESFAKVEHFLRAAEPPAHDEWTHETRAIKQNYMAHGARRKIKRFDQAIISAILDLISIPEEKGGQLPKVLTKHLRFGDKSGGGQPRFMSVTGERAWTDDDTWKFKAKCRRVKESDAPWRIRIKLKYAADGGSGDDVHAISDVSCDAGEAHITIDKGVAHIEVPAEINKVTVSGGASKDKLPAIGTRAAVKLRVEGFKGALADA